VDAGVVSCSGYGFFFVLLGVGRAGFSLVFFRHPIFAGLIWWLISGDVTAIPPAIFFELAWLDLFYVGTYVPPSAMLGYLVYYPLTLLFNLYLPQQAVLLLVLCLPLPALGAKAEIWLRMRQGLSTYDALLEAVDAEKNIQETLVKGILHYLAHRITLAAFVYLCCIGLLFFALWFAGVYLGAWPVGWSAYGPVTYDPRNVTDVLNNWGAVWAVGSVGALLSLRIRPAKICFLTGALGVVVLML
jgi:PTS system mannose-specific IIC component